MKNMITVMSEHRVRVGYNGNVKTSAGEDEVVGWHSKVRLAVRQTGRIEVANPPC